MSDPHRPDDSHAPWRNPGGSEPSALSYPSYPDPAYAGQVPMYTSGYPSQAPVSPPPQQQWGAGQPPAGGSGSDGDDDAPEPPRSPGWLWFVATAAVLLVVGLVIALVIDGRPNRWVARFSRAAVFAPYAVRPSSAPPSTLRFGPH